MFPYHLNSSFYSGFKFGTFRAKRAMTANKKNRPPLCVKFEKNNATKVLQVNTLTVGVKLLPVISGGFAGQVKPRGGGRENCGFALK
eukprot:UN00105